MWNRRCPKWLWYGWSYCTNLHIIVFLRFFFCFYAILIKMKNWFVRKPIILWQTCAKIKPFFTDSPLLVLVILGWFCHIEGLVQERCNSSASAMELHLSCTNPSILWHAYKGLEHRHSIHMSLDHFCCAAKTIPMALQKFFVASPLTLRFNSSLSTEKRVSIVLDNGLSPILH